MTSSVDGTASEKLADWNAHYNTADGKQKVADRQAVYSLVPPGETAPDYDLEIIEGLKTIGLPQTADIVDIGCSYPTFLQKCRQSGFLGELVGIEPNSAQFNGLAYWQLKGSTYQLQHGASVELEGIKLYEAEAGYIPFPDDSFDALTTVFSGYHAFKKRASLYEVKRVLKPDGVHGDATSGNENKEEMIEEDEHELADKLSSRIGQLIVPPEALQAGFTSEDTLEVFPTIYNCVYVKWIKQDLWLETGKEKVLQAHRTYRDSYRPVSGYLPDQYRDLSYASRAVIDENVFEEVLQEVIGQKIDRAIEKNEHVKTKVRRTVTFASDVDLERLEDKGYERISL